MTKAERDELVARARWLGHEEQILGTDVRALYVEAVAAGVNPDRLDKARALGRGDARREGRSG